MNIRNDQPSFGSILWDNIKTTGVAGGFAAGIAPTAATSVAVGVPLLFLGGGGSGTEELMKLAVGVGAVVGTAVALPAGIAIASVLSVPFAISAKYTRQFKFNQEIDAGIHSLFQEFETDTRYQSAVIHQILADDKQNKLGIRSLESFILIEKLQSRRSCEDKWACLHAYMTNKSRNTYIHNGKKLFNTILNVASQIAMQKQILSSLLGAITESNHTYLATVLTEHTHLFTQPGWLRDLLIEHAICAENGEALKIILDKCQDENTNDYDNILSFAISQNKTNMVDVLLSHFSQHYADVKNATPHPYLTIVQNNQNEMLDMLLTKHRDFLHNPKASPLELAIRYAKPEVINTLIAKKHIEPNEILPNRLKPVVYADQNGKHYIANQLVKLGADDNEFELLKSDLKQAIKLIGNVNWSQQGYSLFSRKTPTGVSKLRDIIGNISEQQIDSMPRGNVIQLGRNIRNLVASFEDDRNRTPYTKALYSILGKLGTGAHNNEYHDLQRKMNAPAQYQKNASRKLT